MNKHKADLKYKFDQDFIKVQKYVNFFDPCGFIDAGAPIDEYNCLTNRILSALYNDKTKTEIKELILYEIEHHFGTPELDALTEQSKAKFYKDIEILINRVEQDVKKPSH